jgi:poly-gamma-glutamate capsule biosynthesis protein CapA/YwtB (metallophosphatase superfamily)
MMMKNYSMGYRTFLPFILLTFLLFIPFTGFTQKATLLFGGDVMGHSPQISAALNKQTNTYNYETCFQYVTPIVSTADFAIFNLEVTLAGPPFTGYPAFSSPDALASALKNMGVNCLVTANNHSNDRLGKGLTRTLDVLDTLGLMHTGTYRNKEERDTGVVLLLEVNDIRIAFLNYTYGTNGIPDTPPTIVNLLDTTMMFIDLQQAKALEPDKIIVIAHWGNEYQLNPSSTQKRQYEWLKKNGVDVVIGSHPHVLQPMLWEKTDSTENLVVYSLGNFVSNQRKRYTDGGAMFQLVFEKDSVGNTSISEAGYFLTWVHTPTENGQRQYYVLPAAKYEFDEKLKEAEEDYQQMKLFIEDSRSHLQMNNLNIPEYLYNTETGEWYLEQKVEIGEEEFLKEEIQ